jgi:polyisoprenoid-binding protein YceI
LSSRKGSIQFVVSNDTGYEIDISVALTGGGIEVDDEELELNIPEQQQSVTIDVTATTSGIFGLDVQLKTPDGKLDITDARTITIRSTEYNRIALALTFGALAFLVLFYLIRWMRRRRARADSETSEEVGIA